MLNPGELVPKVEDTGRKSSGAKSLDRCGFLAPVEKAEAIAAL